MNEEELYIDPFLEPDINDTKNMIPLPSDYMNHLVPSGTTDRPFMSGIYIYSDLYGNLDVSLDVNVFIDSIKSIEKDGKAKFKIYKRKEKSSGGLTHYAK